ncbi:maleylacetoacetate isomerase [Rhodanobacter sp. PCA2]|uniref:maleylacetoacetate isomerase n=1 Tax=Rhodanobacter sp. PCA2 TaxID=2006117 RepID=UPI0015E65CAA|nr:maleylacetoacetate isomerase [Rhodanobacter sp. PCA2]MBA2077411.1 maleylacetoacetate isomerase [Rhodanobacter sp. PCA2]
MASSLVLYGYWRSSAAYRVRIALALKGLPWENRPVHLVKDGGQQHAADYASMNPQQLVPSLRDGDRVLTQSLAIMEYLEETRPRPPLLPADAGGRARVRVLAQAVACDIHPLGNLRVLQYLERELGVGEAQRGAWVRHWIAAGFAAMEAMLAGDAATGRYCHGDTPGLADACLVPQVYNAHRWKVALDDYPTIARIAAACGELDAFRAAAPEAQPDAA